MVIQRSEKVDYSAIIEMPCDTFTNTLIKALNCRHLYLTSESKKNNTKISVSASYDAYSLYECLIKAVPLQISWIAEPTTNEKTHFTAKFYLSRSIKFRVFFLVLYMNMLCGLVNAIVFRNTGTISPYLLIIHSTFTLITLIILHRLIYKYRIFLENIIKSCVSNDKIKWDIPVTSNTRFRTLISSDLYWFSGLNFLLFITLYLIKGMLPINHLPLIFKLILLLFLVSTPFWMIVTSKLSYKKISISKIMPTCLNSFAAIIFLFALWFPIAFSESSMKSFIRSVKDTQNLEMPNIPPIQTNSISNTMVRSALYSFPYKYYSLQFAGCLVWILLLIPYGYRLKDYLGGINSLHQKYLQQLINNENTDGNITAYLLLNLSTIAKLLIAIVFLFLSLMFWRAILSYLTIINLLFIPDHQILKFHDGLTIVNMSDSIANMIIERGITTSETINSLKIKLLLPIIIPCSIFLLLHILAALHRVLKKYIHLDNNSVIFRRTSEIASQANISHVSCLIDKNSNKTEIRAQFGGWYPKNRIIFTPRSIIFLEKNPDIIDVIIAHEIAHLKNDCKYFWLTENLSRIGLVGTAFLSVFHNSVAIEKRAYDFTDTYLFNNKLDKKLLSKALKLIQIHKKGDFQNEKNNSLLLFILTKSKCFFKENRFLLNFIKAYSTDKSNIPKFPYNFFTRYHYKLIDGYIKKSTREVFALFNLFKIFVNYFHTIIYFYFYLGWYDYIHANIKWKIKKSQNN